MSSETRTELTGYPSIDRPWMKFWPEQLLKLISIPDCTLNEYVRSKVASEDTLAIHYYGKDIPWSTVFEETARTARALKALGFGENDQIPLFFKNVPEFVYTMLAAELIGASVVCRGNQLHENVYAAAQSGSKIIIGHDFMSQKETDAFAEAGIEKFILLDPLRSGDRSTMPEYATKYLDSFYADGKSSSPNIMNWEDFLAQGDAYTGEVEAPTDITRPLYCSYTTGSTGPSKQVIHSAQTINAILAQINFFGAFAPKPVKWLVCNFPPAMIGVIIGMIFMPLTAGLDLYMAPFVDMADIDLEFMRIKPNQMPMTPQFLEALIDSDRIPEDFDMSFLQSAGVSADSYNNAQSRRAEAFLTAHNCKGRHTYAYGQSESGTAITMPMSPSPTRNGLVGAPLPLSVVSVFEFGTDKELTYNQIGEVCKTGPGNMLGYDSQEATDEVLKVHSDGNLWLHTGDVGYMNEHGELFVLGRGDTHRYGGGRLESLGIDNEIADAEIEGIKDHFSVLARDEAHEGFFEPFLFVILEDGYEVKDIKDKVNAALEPHRQPVEIFEIESRPYYYYKTYRRGMAEKIDEYRNKATVTQA